MMKILIFLFFSYILGSVPFGLLIGKFWKKDVRKEGSKNIGVTNVWRVCGPFPGFLTFIFDCSKGVIPVLVSRNIFNQNDLITIVVGMATISGHIFSPWLGFKGGRGIATGVGVLLAFNFKIAGILFAIWCLIVLISKYISLGSVVVVFLFPFLMVIFGYNIWLTGISFVIAFFVIFRHKDNIKRLICGTENRVSFKRR